jgi:uncharacterized protein YecE (DUF72 family)
MRVYPGTSGFSYQEWKGGFYPADIESTRMLQVYSSRLPTVEINNTFYRMPRAEMVRGWGAQVPDDFRFVIKASRGITHFKQLVDTGVAVGWLYKAVDALEHKLGAVLFQLPPHLEKDGSRLQAFCEILPKDRRSVLEFRHASWYCEEIYDILRAHGVALCGGDPEEVPDAPPIVATANFGYLRLRRDDYIDSEIVEWSQRILGQQWNDAYVFFKHETVGPALALALGAVCAGRPSGLAKTRTAAGPAVAKARDVKPPAKPKRVRRRKGA